MLSLSVKFTDIVKQRLLEAQISGSLPQKNCFICKKPSQVIYMAVLVLKITFICCTCYWKCQHGYDTWLCTLLFRNVRSDHLSLPEFLPLPRLLLVLPHIYRHLITHNNKCLLHIINRNWFWFYWHLLLICPGVSLLTVNKQGASDKWDYLETISHSFGTEKLRIQIHCYIKLANFYSLPTA